MTLFFRAKITFAVTLGLSLIALSHGASSVTINTLIEDAHRETLVQGNTLRLEQLVSRFKATESLQRRYLLTEAGKDLSAYRQARENLLTELSQTRLAFGSNEGGADFRLLLDLISRRMDQIEQTAVARGTASTSKPAMPVRCGPKPCTWRWVSAWPAKKRFWACGLPRPRGQSSGCR